MSRRNPLTERAAQLVLWADSVPSSFDPAKDLQPLLYAKLALSPDLPINIFTQYLEVETVHAGG